MTVAIFGNIKNSRMRLIGSMGLLLLFPMAAKAQYLPQWEDYKRWELHFDKVWYLPAKADKKYGIYDIDTKIMRGIGFGFEYNFRPHETWSFFTGLDMDLLPFSNYYYDIKRANLPNDNWPDEDLFDNVKYINQHNVLSIPLGITVKQPIGKNFFWNISFMIKNTFIQYGGFESGIIFYSTQQNKQNETVEIIHIDANSDPRSIWYPSANLNLGISFISKYALIKLDTKFQKTFFPYFKGEYRFYNLKNVEDTYGTYKVQGDYFGLGLTITPRKIKTLKY